MHCPQLGKKKSLPYTLPRGVLQTLKEVKELLKDEIEKKTLVSYKIPSLIENVNDTLKNTPTVGYKQSRAVWGVGKKLEKNAFKTKTVPYFQNMISPICLYLFERRLMLDGT